MDPVNVEVNKAINLDPVISNPQSAEEQEERFDFDQYIKHSRARRLNTPVERFKSGLKGSSGGILTGFGPTKEELEARGLQDPSFLLDALENAATLIGDLPAFASGSAVGGAVTGGIGASAAGFAAPELVKSIYQEYLDHIDSGEQLTFSEFLNKLGRVGKKTGIAAAEGAVVGLAAGALGKLANTPRFEKLFNFIPKQLGGAKLSKHAVSAVGETAALSAASSLIGGQELSVENFAHNLATILALKVGHGLASRVKNVIKGKPPAEQTALIESMKGAKTQEEAAKKLETKLLEFQSNKEPVTKETKTLGTIVSPEESAKKLEEVSEKDIAPLKKQANEIQSRIEKIDEKLKASPDDTKLQDRKSSYEKHLNTIEEKINRLESSNPKRQAEREAAKPKGKQEAVKSPETVEKPKNLEKSVKIIDKLHSQIDSTERSRAAEVKKGEALVREEQRQKDSLERIRIEYEKKKETATPQEEKTFKRVDKAYEEKISALEKDRKESVAKVKELVSRRDALIKEQEAHRKSISPQRKEAIKEEKKPGLSKDMKKVDAEISKAEEHRQGLVEKKSKLQADEDYIRKNCL